MFTSPQTACLTALFTAILAWPVPATAGEGIPVTINLADVQSLSGPLYVSIQTEGEYMGVKGHGGIIKDVGTTGATVTYDVPEAGRYAVSLWHDLNDDGVFSMDESYRILDGWGGSGDLDPGVKPSFADAAIDVPTYGTSVKPVMFYPDTP